MSAGDIGSDFEMEVNQMEVGGDDILESGSESKVAAVKAEENISKFFGF